MLGIPFSTRISHSEQPTPLPHKTLQGLGFLPFQYCPSPSNYSAYLNQQDHLPHHDYARTALMKGGIIARLACDSLGDCINVVIGGGPSEDVLGYGMAIKIGSEYLWDDNLDPNDEQVICGVYKISTGKH